jgi:hypothetical protein
VLRYKGTVSKDNSTAGPKPDPNSDGNPSAPDAKADAKSTGRVQFDDRGNAVWEWSLATGAFGRDVSTERLQTLEHPALSIAADTPTPLDIVRANPLGTKNGYNPYDSGKLGKAPAPPRKKDLRRLSEFLKLKKQAAGNKDDKE